MVDDIDDCDYIQKPALPVEDMVIEDIDFNDPPASAEEYLFRVRFESSQLPPYVKADGLPPSDIHPNSVIEEDSIVVPPFAQTTADWRTKQLEYFETAVERVRNMKNPNVKTKIETPKLHDEREWYKMCFENDDEKQNLPRLSFLLQLTQPQVLYLLEYHVDWLKQHGYSKERAQWIYSLMALLVKPLVPDTCACLRKLARILKLFRSTLVNTVLCFVLIIFITFYGNNAQDENCRKMKISVQLSSDIRVLSFWKIGLVTSTLQFCNSVFNKHLTYRYI